MLFFTFSTTQEYYSMPIYPALALLLGSAMSSIDLSESRWIKAGNWLAGAVSAAAAVLIVAVLYAVRHAADPGDISRALQQHPEASYTLSLGHIGDLTLQAFAYLRAPLLLAVVACLVGACGAFLLSGRCIFLALAVMMVLLSHASRMALVTFDPYLSSRPLAEALERSPQGNVIVDGAYYPFSSLLFYADRDALLLNGRINNLEYGSYATGAPAVFIDDERFTQLWTGPARYYLVADGTRVDALRRLAGSTPLHTVVKSGGKFLFVNHLPSAAGSCLSISEREKPRASR
jgi:hypothetical protein